MSAQGRGLLIAAPSSGAGKTTVTLGLLRALRDRGVDVRGAKSGPDYIDPAFHAAASGRPCGNLDAFAMTPPMVRALAAGPGLLLVEGAMGLFDGAPPNGAGASAELAAVLDIPVVLVVDAAAMAQSVAPLVAGFARHDPQVRIAGVILNRVGSARHARMLQTALAPLGLPVLGCLPRAPGLALPSRHLGLVQAAELLDLERTLTAAVAWVADHVDLDAIQKLAAPLPSAALPSVTPPAQRIAVAQDAAFGFAYTHLLAGWRAAGAEILPFSPLANDAPSPQADLIFLPGGYPELHAGRLAAAERFLSGLRQAATRGVAIYGECGGYMVLGDGMLDAEGHRHAMAGLLRLETSFADRCRHLGYRWLRAEAGPFPGAWGGHEFHYATTLRAEGPPLFQAWDAEATPLDAMGLRAGPVCGSFAHLIAPRPDKLLSAPGAAYSEA